MGIARCMSAHMVGLTAGLVVVEVDISNGLNSVSIVGLGDRAVTEAKDRVSAAVKNSGFVSPKQKNQKVVISLAPADVPKEGPAFDLAIALAYLSAVGETAFDFSRTIFLGELSLEGEVRRVDGILPILCRAKTLGFDRAFVPTGNAGEAALAEEIVTYAVSSLNEVIAHLRGERLLTPIVPLEYEAAQAGTVGDWTSLAAGLIRPAVPDMRSIRGNESPKRALEIAAAGAHNILLYGPPGTGKTMLAKSFCGILPPLSREEAVEVTGIHSAARALGTGFVRYPPLRAPHHTASYPAVVGGGAFPRPGEITLAHRGVLFLDELPEFSRDVLEALREPLEERTITISRARGSVTFPAQCIFIASMNPCPCGMQRGVCICTPKVASAYRRRVSGPVMDRIDIWTTVAKIDYAGLAMEHSEEEPSETIGRRVASARAIQKARFDRYGLAKRFNAELDAADIERVVMIDPETRVVLSGAAKRLRLSGRAFHKVIKVARTIADLAGLEAIGRPHVMEALQYRQQPGSG